MKKKKSKDAKKRMESGRETKVTVSETTKRLACITARMFSLCDSFSDVYDYNVQSDEKDFTTKRYEAEAAFKDVMVKALGFAVKRAFIGGLEKGRVEI